MNQSAVKFAVRAIVVATCVGTPATVLAQPGNPGPSTFVNLGDLGIGQSLQSADVPIAAGATIWFRFKLTTPISPLLNWLDLDTAGPSGITNTEMAIYDARGNKLGENNDSGGGATGGGGGNVVRRRIGAENQRLRPGMGWRLHERWFLGTNAQCRHLLGCRRRLQRRL